MLKNNSCSKLLMHDCEKYVGGILEQFVKKYVGKEMLK